jgi:hypothetical protein
MRKTSTPTNSDKSFLKIEIRAIPFAMTAIASPPPMTAPEAGNSLAHPLYASVMALIRRKRPKKKKMPGGSAQPFEKAHFGQGNPSKSKLFLLEKFGRGLGWLGWILQNLASALKMKPAFASAANGPALRCGLRPRPKHAAPSGELSTQFPHPR